MRDLIKRWQAGEYSPRAWGLMRTPLEELERDPLPIVSVSNEKGRYVLHLG
jgi:hypothetical protein